MLSLIGQNVSLAQVPSVALMLYHILGASVTPAVHITHPGRVRMDTRETLLLVVIVHHAVT
jgi:hypothetical protein